MKDLNEEKQARFTENFYYSCLYNSLVLFAATPHYLQVLDGPGFDIPFEMESEFDYAFREPAFDSILKAARLRRNYARSFFNLKTKLTRYRTYFGNGKKLCQIMSGNLLEPTLKSFW